MRSKREKWTVVMAVIVILSVIGLVVGLVALCEETQQVRQTLCTLRCQHIEDDAAWEACIGECLMEVANDQ